ncbi:MAG: extracellular solute-binding protein [Christensenellaceae bacterium]|jgi:ABC-type glycerol-3-phosphate transport system substrate-binding protein|nr:extracellular solute-binding protein [Christensenellaceae bacterium]
MTSKRACRLLGLILTLSLLLAGCQAPSGAPESGTAAPTAGAATPEPNTNGSEASADALAEHLTLTANVRNAEVQGADALWDYFAEKFNVTIELIPMSFNERHEKARIWVSSGDMPDLLWMDLDEKMFAEYANWVRQGMFKAYPADIAEKYPNIGTEYGLEVNVGDELMTIDGALYAHPAIRGNPEYDFMSGMSWVYRRDWAKAVGLYKEGDLYTWDEFVALNEAFVKQDPGGNGPGKTIGMGTEIFYFPHAFGIYQTSAEFGYGSFSPKDGKYVWTTARHETLEGLKIAKDLYDRGIIWPDNPLGQAPDDQFKAGLMGSDFNNFDQGRLDSCRKALQENFPEIDPFEAMDYAFVVGPDGTLWCKQSQCYWGAVCMSAKLSDEKAARWLTMLDWMLSDEGKYFRMYGIPGKDYSIENGSLTCLWPQSEIYADLQADPYPQNVRQWYMDYSGGVSAQVVPNVSTPKQTIADANAKFQYLKDKGFMRAFDYASSYLSAPSKDASGNFTTETSDKMIELLTTVSADQLETEWTNWLASMEEKVQPVLDELNSMIADVPTEAAPKVFVP